MVRVTLVAFAVKEKAMSTGNLEGKLVASDFWPACENCHSFEACKVRPLHPAYPHTWHWGKESASFPEGELVLLSWVGTAAVGAPHTACENYEAGPQHFTAPLPHHQHYLALEKGRQDLDVQLEGLEREGALSKETEALYVQLFRRFTKIIEEQRALRTDAEAGKPAAA
jgi:hypothetical protein